MKLLSYVAELDTINQHSRGTSEMSRGEKDNPQINTKPNNSSFLGS